MVKFLIILFVTLPATVFMFLGGWATLEALALQQPTAAAVTITVGSITLLLFSLIVLGKVELPVRRKK